MGGLGWKERDPGRRSRVEERGREGRELRQGVEDATSGGEGRSGDEGGHGEGETRAWV